MKRFARSVSAAMLSSALFALAAPAQASLVNGGFENNLTNWNASGHVYLVTDNGAGRTRHDYLSYQGWEGADVWFSGSPKEGTTYAVVGSNGNESDGTLELSGYASNQFLSFWQLGNDTSMDPATHAFAQILDGFGNVLSTLYTPSFNDSLWREYTFDLSSLGLFSGDAYSFRYTDGASWSIVDNVSEFGPALEAAATVPEPGSIALVGSGLLLLGAGRVRRARPSA